jgi:hypothetical protein
VAYELEPSTTANPKCECFLFRLLSQRHIATLTKSPVYLAVCCTKGLLILEKTNDVKISLCVSASYKRNQKSYLEEEPVSELQDCTNAQIPPKDKDRLHFAPALFPLTHLFRHTDAEVKTSHGYHIIMVEGRK